MSKKRYAAVIGTAGMVDIGLIMLGGYLLSKSGVVTPGAGIAAPSAAEYKPIKPLEVGKEVPAAEQPAAPGKLIGISYPDINIAAVPDEPDAVAKSLTKSAVTWWSTNYGLSYSRAQNWLKYSMGMIFLQKDGWPKEAIKPGNKGALKSALEIIRDRHGLCPAYYCEVNESDFLTSAEYESAQQSAYQKSL